MAGGKPHEMPLGRQVPPPARYAPELLYPISRAAGRRALGIGGPPPFCGCDLWHAYEVSWLDRHGKPQVRVGRFQFPADSPHIVESKSFKLYLNSLNSERYGREEDIIELLRRDLGAVVGAAVGVDLLPVDAPELAGFALQGTCLDDLELEVSAETPSPELLRMGEAVKEEILYSHLLRSLCPVTGQPDWASVWLRYRGRALEHASLLRYLVAFRNHREFHEQCVERMFVDIQQRLEPELLEIQALYTRRGGLDINPFRSTRPEARPLARMNRQ